MRGAIAPHGIEVSMATRTTNYGLYKSDPTDPFEDFRAEHNANMEIIDQHLGGGGGGSSVAWNQIQQSGTKIAEISINGVSTDVFAPDGGGGGGGDGFFHLYVMNGGNRHKITENISHVIT